MRSRVLLFLVLLTLGASASAVTVPTSAFLRLPAPAGGLPYRLYLPPFARPGERLPLIVFLHGSGQDGTDNDAQIAYGGNGALELLDDAISRRIPVLFAAPQTPHEYWRPAAVMAVIRAIEAHWPVDRDRIYLTGLSSGATGVWDTAKAWPDRFAALVPMSGATEIAGLNSIAPVPEWVFHSADDNDTNVVTGFGGAMKGSRTVVAALRAAGGHPCYTEYAHGPQPATHVIWPEAYATSGLLHWMLAQRRGRPSPLACPPDARSR